MFPVMKASLVAVTTFGGAILSLAIVSRPAIAGSLFITIEAPGVQQSQLTTNPSAYGATNVAVENFDSQPVG